MQMRTELLVDHSEEGLVRGFRQSFALHPPPPWQVITQQLRLDTDP